MTRIAIAALQHHERENGSDYPQGLRRDALRDLARVVSVTVDGKKAVIRECGETSDIKQSILRHVYLYQ